MVLPDGWLSAPPHTGLPDVQDIRIETPVPIDASWAWLSLQLPAPSRA